MDQADNRNPIEVVAGLGKDLGKDIGEYIRQQRDTAQISLRQLSKLAGVSNPYLSQIERGLRRPSAEILQQIAKGLRISAEALYVRAGFLDAPEGGPVTDAIRAATELTERQKQVLLDVYETFRRANASDAAAGDTAVGGTAVGGTAVGGGVAPNANAVVRESYQSTVEGSGVDMEGSTRRTPPEQE
jgi:transcriptional regulator with XRE-family HTH domain